MRSVDAYPRRPVRAGLLFLAILVTACPAAVLAQPGGVGRGGFRRAGSRAEDLRETITLLMMVRMKSEVGLSEKQYEQILPLVEQREHARQDASRERRDLWGRLQALVARDAALDSEFQTVIDRLAALEDSERKHDDTLVQSSRKILTPRQQARFVLFRQRFRGWLEQRLRDARELRRPGGRGPAAGPGSPGSGDPDEDQGDDPIGDPR